MCCGSITLDQYDVTEKEYRNLIGYLPQDFGYYPEFTGMEFLLYVAALKGLDPKERVRFRHIFEQLGRDNIVLLSTHIVSDIEKCADRVMVIKEGKKVFDGMEEETGKDLEAFYLNIFGGEE